MRVEGEKKKTNACGIGRVKENSGGGSGRGKSAGKVSMEWSSKTGKRPR